MVEQKTTKEILSTAIKDFDVFPSQKGVRLLIYVNQELDNQVWLRKDEIMKRLKFIAKTDCWNIRDKVNLLIKELDGSLAPEEKNEK